MKINAHGHLLPEPKQIPQFMKDKKLFWIDDQKQFMLQGNWSRPITDASFFLNDKLIWMEKNSIDREVILNLSQLYANGLSFEDSKDILQFQNDFNAEIQALYPNKFYAGFVVQPKFIDLALSEIERSVSLGLQILCLPTHYLNHENQWISVADESCFPIFELANHYKLSIEIHPYDAELMVPMKDRFWRYHLIWMCAQTADTYHLYTLLDFPTRFPHIKTCFAHAGQFAMMGYGRRVQGYNGRPDLFPGAVHPEKNSQHKNIFVDSLTHDYLSLSLVIQRIGLSQVLAGIDDPYPLGEMETVPHSYPGKVIDDLLEHQIITETDKNNIWHKNVNQWLNK